MSREFSDILRGLLENRGLAPQPVSVVSGHSRTTIVELLRGGLEPTAQILADIAPALRMPLADLLVIAGLPTSPAPDLLPPLTAAKESGELLAIARSLRPAQVAELIEHALRLRAANDERREPGA